MPPAAFNHRRPASEWEKLAKKRPFLVVGLPMISIVLFGTWALKQMIEPRFIQAEKLSTPTPSAAQMNSASAAAKTNENRLQNVKDGLKKQISEGKRFIF